MYAGHELFHKIKKSSPELAQELQDFIIDTLKSRPSYGYEARFTELEGKYEDDINGLSDAEKTDYIHEEMAANSCFTVFTDENNFTELAKKNHDLAQRIRDFFKEFINKLRERLAILSRINPEYNAIKDDVEAKEKILDIMNRALADEQKNNTTDGVVKSSAKESDIIALRAIGKKSVNDFTDSDIKASEIWAKKFYKELGTKSPFFRAWFGDWRAHDASEVKIAKKKGKQRGLIKNKDTNFDINVSGKIFNEAKVHQSTINVNAVPYLEYIDDIVEKAILIDTKIISEEDTKSINSLFMHEFYAIADIGNGETLLRLYVEEMNNPNAEDNNRRAYSLQNIEQLGASGRVQTESPISLTNTPSYEHSVAELHNLVKKYDKKFNPKPVSEYMLNDDGKPQVFYHGTDYYEPISVFKRGKYGYLGRGIYLSSDENYAKRYATKSGDDGTVYAEYANIKNPIVCTTSNATKEVLNAIYGSDAVYNRRSAKQSFDSRIITSTDIKKAREKGFDGVVWLFGGSKEISVWQSNQVKSVDNLGTFNTYDDRHMFSRKENIDSEGRTLSEGQVTFFKNVASELRDESDNIKPFYHGTSRADRVGSYFDPERATSGPMAYFTDNKEIAENYSRDKADTSLAYDSEYDTYETQFRVNVNGDSVSIVDYWYELSPKEKIELTEKIKQVTLDDDYETVILKPDNKYGIGNFNDYEMRYARGNAIQVLVDGWLGGGTLFGQEEKFLDVLDKIGIKNAEYKNPNYREEKVYECYLNITNPFNTDNLDQEFIDDLTDYVDNTDLDIYYKETANADLWDKNNIDIYDWIDKLQDDLYNGTTHAWTSIPDVVTDFLKEYGGYDGIIDKGGKGGGVGHTVAIPFYSNQIKSVDNRNPSGNVDIHLSRKENAAEHKQKQFDIINAFNPAHDDVHTWIRSADDVRTWQEAINDSEASYTPDFTEAMAQQALTDGRIKVYSSKDIGNGAFVTPSRMEARAYAGQGRVYSKTVDIDNVAWIDTLQGQYAEVDDTRYARKSFDFAENTHSGENLLDTPDFLKPQTERERSVFVREFANKTNGLKNGKKKNIIIITADYNYYVQASGYMKGTIVQKEQIDENLFYEVKERQNGIDKSTKAFSRWFADVRVVRRGGYWNFANTENRGQAVQNDAVDSTTLQNVNEFGYYWGGDETVPGLTTDDNGDIIFSYYDENDELITEYLDDINYSRKEGWRTYHFLEKNEDLVNISDMVGRVVNIINRNDDLHNVIGDVESQRVMLEEYAEKTARYLRKTYSSNYNKRLLMDRLKSIYEYALNAGDNYDPMYYAMQTEELARDILTATDLKDSTEYDRNADTRKYIRNNTIFVSEQVMNDMPDYEEFRRRNFGRMRLSSTKGMPLDQMYNELVELAPDYFPSDAVLSEQLENISYFFDATGIVYHNGAEEFATAEGFSIDEYVAKVCADIQDRLLEIPKVHRVIVSSEDRGVKDLLADLTDEMNDLNADIIERFHEQKEQVEQEQKDKYIAKDKKRRDRHELTEIKRKFRNLERKINRKLVDPTETSYVPQNLVNSISAVCKILNEADSTERLRVANETNKRMENNPLYVPVGDLHSAYSELRKNEKITYDYRSEYDEYMDDHLLYLKNKIGSKDINDLSLDEMREVYRTVREIYDTLVDATKQIGRGERISNHELGVQIIREFMAAPGRRSVFIGKYELSTMSPERAIRKMTDYNDDSTLLKMYYQLVEGQRKADKFISDAMKPFDNLISRTKEMRSFQTDLIETSIKLDNGENLFLTREQIAQIYMTAKRNQGLSHLMKGGFTATNIEDMKKDNRKEAIDHGSSVSDLDISFVNEMYSLLDDYSKEWIAAAEHFFNTVSRYAINETSMLLKHRNIAREHYYIPLIIDKNFLHTDIDGLIMDRTIEGAGMLKSTNQFAGTPLIISGLTNVIEQHMKNVSQYYGLAIPIRNFQKVYNVATSEYYDGDMKKTTVKETIENKWGSDGTEFIESIIRDLQSPRMTEMLSFDITRKPMTKWKNAFVTSVLAGNISVTIKQAASYPTAGAILSANALAAGLKGFGYLGNKYENMCREIDEHTGTHYKRRKGMSTEELGEIVRSKKKKNKKLSKLHPAKWIQALDVQTTLSLWIACKYEIEHQYSKLEKGSPEYWQKVTNLYDEVIEKTQPNYDVLNRPEVLKTQNQLFKAVFMFKTQPMQNTGIVYDSYFEMVNKSKQHKNNQITDEEWKRSKRKFRKAITSQLVSAFVFNAMSLAASIIKHKMGGYKDEDGEVTWKSVIFNFILNELSLFTSILLPIGGSEMFEFFRGWKNGKSYDMIDFPALSALNDFLSSCQKLKKTAEGVIDGNKSATDLIRSSYLLAEQFAGAFGGKPVKNLSQLVQGIYENVVDICNGDFLQFKYSLDNTGSSVQQKLNVIEKELADGKTDKYEEYSDDLYHSSSSYKLLYLVLKQYGYNSSEYNTAYDACYQAKLDMGSENPGIDDAMANKALTDYAECVGEDDNKADEYYSLAVKCVGEKKVAKKLENADKQLEKKQLAAVKEYKRLKDDKSKNYQVVEKQRLRCIKICGSMEKVNTMLKDLD